jgi:beta-aspartyl-dipeptidase (metallo-type)
MELPMLTLIRNGSVLAPEPLGVRDILLADRTIAALTEPGRLSLGGLDVETIEASGRLVYPGLIDPHVHILGGGGEGGPATRAPEITLEDIVTSGVTTLIGCLGTDSVTRHMTSLLAKARALEAEGVTTYIFSGSYEIPVTTITGSIRSDLVLIDKVIGAGEIALSDHRSSQPTFEEFARLAAECRVGGLLGGKAGVVHCHLGDGPRGLQMIFRLVRETEIPARQVIPTHMNRNRPLLEEGLEFMKLGGCLDFTAGTKPQDENEKDLSAETAVEVCLSRHAPLTQVMISSDGNGSQPVFDAGGRLMFMEVAKEQSLLRTFQSLLKRKVLSPYQAALIFAANPAEFYKLSRKGGLEEGKDADLIILDEAFDLADVWAMGRRLMAEGKLLAHGTFSGRKSEE